MVPLNGSDSVAARCGSASPATAWKSLRRAGSVRLAAGDALLLKRGEQWIRESGDALVLRNASGLVSSYGKPTQSQPLIQVSSRGSWAACVRLYDATQLTVTGLRLAPHRAANCCRRVLMGPRSINRMRF